MNKIEVPKEGIRLFAMIKAHELKENVELKTDEQAINYLRSIGIEVVNTKTEIIEQLKAENEQLKQQLEDIGKSWDEIQRLREERENLIEQLVIYNQFGNSYNKYRQTLQEIKAIAEGWMNNDWSCFRCRSNMDEKLQDIIDLITKAEEE